MARLFLDAGASVAEMGQALQKALMEGHDKVVELLVERGLDIGSVDRRVWDTCRQRGFGWIVDKFRPATEGVEAAGSYNPRTPLGLSDVVTGDFMVACNGDGSPWCLHPTIAKVSVTHGDLQIAQYRTPPSVFKPRLEGPPGRKFRGLKSTDILPVESFGRQLREDPSGKLYHDEHQHYFRLYHADMVFTRRKQADGKFLRGWAFRDECM
jgi:hypothetical protein